MSVVGLDLGTSGVRAVVFAADGRVLATARRGLALSRPAPGRVELDADQVVAAAEEALREAAVGAGDDVPQALGFSVLGEAVVPVDADRRPLAPAAVSMDTRGDAAAAELGACIGADRFTRLTGQPLHGMFSVFKIAAGDERWRRADAFRCIGDLLAERWTGVAGIDASQAARMGALDVDSGAWSAEILDALAADAPWLAEHALPRVVSGGSLIGRLSAAAAETLGLPADLPVVAGAHDQAAAHIGAGGTPRGRAVVSFGSSDCVTVSTTTRPDGLAGTGFATYRVDDARWVTLAGTAAGGWALEWLAGMLGAPLDEVFGALAEAPPRLLFLPYLAGSGTLDNDPAAVGALVGLSLDTTRPELARAVIEGAGLEVAKIAAALRERGVGIDEIALAGSGSANPAAVAARADAVGLPLVPTDALASARGAAVLAAPVAGLDPAHLVPPAQPAVAPDAATVDWYARQRRAYAELYPATRGIAHHLSSSEL